MQTPAVELDGFERVSLDALMTPKAVDPSLSFRRSCRDSVRIGRYEHQRRERPRTLTTMCTLPDTIALEPLPGLPAIREGRARLCGRSAASLSLHRRQL